MKKIYILRHQHHGFVTTHAFTEPPTVEQLAPVIADLETRHAPAILIGDLAALHPADPHGSAKIPAGSPPWLTLVAVDVYEPGEVPKAYARGVASGAAGSGVGRVE